jgi:coproporphyrinogen III oxidase-like Fe-S oxidoreductase
LTVGGYRWYETANFCRQAARAGGRDLRARHNLAYWRGRDYLGLGIGAVSTLGDMRRRNRPGLGAYVATLGAGAMPPAELEHLDDETKARERLLLGLRLDEPLQLTDVADALDQEAVERLVSGRLVEIRSDAHAGGPTMTTLALTRRGRFVGGGVSAELMRLAPS